MEFSSENQRRTALNHAVTLAANGKITGGGMNSVTLLATSVTAAAAEFERYLKHGGTVTD